LFANRLAEAYDGAWLGTTVDETGGGYRNANRIIP
jgi:hypothetical protein